jgi:biotin operon repressor
MPHGTWIPRGVLERADLPLSARVLYGLIDALDRDEGCFASNAWIAQHLGLTKRQVQNLLNTLVEKGLVVRRVRDRKRFICTVEADALHRVSTPSEGHEADFTPPVKSVSPPPRNPLHPDRIEDNKEDNTPQPPWGDRMKKAWGEWVAFRKERKAKLTPLSISKQFTMLAALSSEDEAVECIQQSIRNGWQGLFPPKQVMIPKKPLTSSDHANGF